MTPKLRAVQMQNEMLATTTSPPPLRGETCLLLACRPVSCTGNEPEFVSASNGACPLIVANDIFRKSRSVLIPFSLINKLLCTIL